MNSGGRRKAVRRRFDLMETTERQLRKGRRRPVKRKAEEPLRDPIARAFEREREHARVAVPEREAVWAHAFRCVCCGRMRGEQERREERSLVCIRCVREAGYWN